MNYLLDQMPDEARLWVYQSERQFTGDELEVIKEKIEFFLFSWAAHGTSLKQAYRIVHNQVIVLAVDEVRHWASGCSIDDSVNFIRSLEKELGLSLLDRGQLGFLINYRLVIKPLKFIKAAIESGQIKSDDILLNNAVADVGSFKNSWEQRVDNSWLKRYLA